MLWMIGSRFNGRQIVVSTIPPQSSGHTKDQNERGPGRSSTVTRATRIGGLLGLLWGCQSEGFLRIMLQSNHFAEDSASKNSRGSRL